MAGLTWIVVFAVTTLIGMWRGWTWLFVISLFCMGYVASANNSDVAQAIVGGSQAFLANMWAAVVGALNAAAN